MGLREVLRKLDVHDGMAFLKTIRSRSLRAPARAFVWNNTRVAGLLSLPVDLVAYQLIYREAESSHRTAQMRALRRRASDSYAITAEQEISRLRKQYSRYEWAIQILLQTGAVLAWTTVECCAKDVWIACAAARPRLVPAKVLEQKVSVKSLVTVDGVIEDVGELLSLQYSFKNARNINEAYRDLFGNQLHPHVGQALGTSDLHTLEQVRHLIVHSGGIVDDEFRARTPYRTKSGRALILSEAKLVQYANAATRLCKELLQFADGWLRGTRARP